MDKEKRAQRSFRLILLELSLPKELFEKNMAARGVDSKRLGRFLKRMPVVVRRGLDARAAKRYRDVFSEAGAKVIIDEEKRVEEDEILVLPPFEPDITPKPDRIPVWLIMAALVAALSLVLYIFYPKDYRLRVTLSPGDKAYYTYSSKTVSKLFKRRTRNPDATVVITADMNLYQEVKRENQGILDLEVRLEHVDLDLEVKTRSLMDHSRVDKRLRETEKGLQGRVLTYRIDRRGRLVSASSTGRSADYKDQVVRLIERALLGIELPEKSVNKGQWWTSRLADNRYYFMEFIRVERLKGRKCALIEVATRKSPLAEPRGTPDTGRVKSEVRVNGRVYLDLATGRVVLMDSEMTSVQKKVPVGKEGTAFVVLTEGKVRLELE